jgi:hypothetical protein
MQYNYQFQVTAYVQSCQQKKHKKFLMILGCGLLTAVNLPAHCQSARLVHASVVATVNVLR